MANPSHDYADDFKDIFRRLEALETYPRVPNITAGGINAATTSSLLGNTPTTSWAAVSGAQSVTFEATEQGLAVVLAFVNHTLEVSSGYPTVYLGVGIGSAPANEQYAVSISSFSSPFTQTDAIVAYFTGLLPGTNTATFYSKREVAGDILSYTLNSQALVVIPF